MASCLVSSALPTELSSQLGADHVVSSLYNKSLLMSGPLGNRKFCFPQISMFPLTLSRETLRFSGNKIHCSPRDQSLSVNCYIARLSLNKMSTVIG